MTLDEWVATLKTGDASLIAESARQIADVKSDPRTEFTFTVCDKFWTPIGAIGDDLIEAAGTDPRNNLGAGTIKIKGSSKYISTFQDCKNTMIGVIVETNGARWPFYVDTFDYEYANGSWTGTVSLLSIWDILNYLVIWPEWYLPIQAQPVSHAIFLGGMVTCIQAMVGDQALRIQSGLHEFINNLLSGNLDVRAWFGTLLQSNGNLTSILKTPIYVVRTNPWTDGSPLLVRTVRMETVGTIVKDVTKPYGVEVNVDLWLPGDPQPDYWTETLDFMRLTQPTYVVTVKDRSQITGPTGTVLDSVIGEIVNVGGSLIGDIISPLISEVPGMDGVFYSPALGQNYVPPWQMIVAPEPGEKSPLVNCKITDHTPKGWQHIIGGRSPAWLNNLINATLSWLIDSLSIVIGITGLPSDMLSGFMNNAFFAFQLIQLYERRDQMGPYHPCIEVFTATTSAPYNVETLFQFINKFWDTRGYTSASLTFRNGEPYFLGKDLLRGGLFMLVFMGRTRIYTDYIENTMWRISAEDRDVMVQVGDGKAEEAPLAKHQRNFTGLLESINVATLSPQT